LGATACFVAPLVLGPAACSSGGGGGVAQNSNPGNGNSSTTSNGSSTVDTSSGSSSGSNTGASSASATCPPDKLDDMTAMAGPTVTGGYWYTYSDRTCVSPLPALIKPDAAGILNPEEGQQYVAMDDGNGPTPPCETAPMPYRDFSGSGETVWGAGMGFDFEDSPASPPPFGSCASAENCTGVEAPNAYIPMGDGGNAYATPIDTTNSSTNGPHKGIAFYARAPMTTSVFKLDVHLSDDTTTPGGGKCDQCLYGGPALDGGTIRCSDDWIETVSLTKSWQQFTIKFTDTTLKTGGWSSTPAKAILASAMHLDKMYYMHFQVSTNNDGNPLKAFDVQVAYVTWVD
jgi:hypothetical protein